MVCLAVVLTGCGLSLTKKANAPEVKKEVVVNNAATSSEKIATMTKNLAATSTDMFDTGEWNLYSDLFHGFTVKIPDTNVYFNRVGACFLSEAYDAKLCDFEFWNIYDKKRNASNAEQTWLWESKMYESGNNFETDSKALRMACHKNNFYYICIIDHKDGRLEAAEAFIVLFHSKVRISIGNTFASHRLDVIDFANKEGVNKIFSDYLNGVYSDEEKKSINILYKEANSLEFLK